MAQDWKRITDLGDVVITMAGQHDQMQRRTKMKVEDQQRNEHNVSVPGDRAAQYPNGATIETVTISNVADEAYYPMIRHGPIAVRIPPPPKT